MNDIIKATERSVATIADNVDPFDAFADAVAPQHVLGKLLKFSKGDWLAGENSELVEQKAFMAGMHAMMVGWVRWRDFKPTDHCMVCIGSRLLPPRRYDLGDNDQSTWEVDDRGQKRDPWQLTSYLPLIAADDDEIYTFTAASKGARDALGKLARRYASHRRSQPDKLPVITLGVSGYQHPRREFGYIKTPLLSVTGWADVSRFDEIMTLAGYGLPDNGEPAAVEIAAPAKPAAVETNTAKPNDLNDEIPF